MAKSPKPCPHCQRGVLEKRATVDFSDDRSTPRRAGGIIEYLIFRRRSKRTWLCTSCGYEIPRKLGFWDRN